VFEALEERGIEAVIKPRWNSVQGPRSSTRGRMAREFQEALEKCSKGIESGGVGWGS